MSFWISDAVAQAPAPAGSAGDPLMSLIFPIGLILIFYFFLIRPQMKRQKEHKKLVEALQKGDEVQLEGGLIGRVAELGENFAKVELAEGVEVKVRRQSVMAILPKGSLKEM
jgi:preprotein translocase subunit YajC